MQIEQAANIDGKKGREEKSPSAAGGTRYLSRLTSFSRAHEKQIESLNGCLTIWAGGNSEDFLDDMWHLDLNHDVKWHRTRYAVCGALPEPVFRFKPHGVSSDMKRAVVAGMGRPIRELEAGSRSGLLETKSSSSTKSVLPMDVSYGGGGGVEEKPNQNQNQNNEKSRNRNSGCKIALDLSLGSSHSVAFVVEQHYHVLVSKAILTARSGQFRTMFTSKMRESRERVVELPGVKLKVFLCILCFLYSGNLPVCHHAGKHIRNRTTGNRNNRNHRSSSRMSGSDTRSAGNKRMMHSGKSSSSSSSSSSSGESSGSSRAAGRLGRRSSSSTLASWRTRIGGVAGS